MARLRRTTDARNDLTAIWLYVAQDNLPAADRLMEEINHTLKLLLRFPLLGDSVDHLSWELAGQLLATISCSTNRLPTAFVYYACITRATD